jgi:hypothetical protein
MTLIKNILSFFVVMSLFLISLEGMLFLTNMFN